MRSLYPRLLGSTSVVAASPAAGAETAVAVLTGVASVNPEDVITFNAQVYISTVGATTTAIRTRVRRGGLTGTVVADDFGDNHAVVAGGIYVVQLHGSDQPGDVASVTYTLTLLMIAGSAATTIDGLYFSATCW